MDSFNFDGLVEGQGVYDLGGGSFPKPKDFGSRTYSYHRDYNPDRFIFLPEPDTGGYIPEPGFTYGNVFGGDLFGGGSLPADPYAGSEVSRSFGSPRSSYVDDTKQRMGSLLANVIDSFKIGNSPRSVI